MVACYRRHKLLIDAHVVGTLNVDLDTLRHARDTILKIEYAVSTLDSKSREIIKHMLEDDDQDPNWFYDLYSESTFNRRKAIAFASFIEALKI